MADVSPEPIATFCGDCNCDDSSVDLRAGQRCVDDGDIVTSAGVSAGIDMALHFVGRFGGAEESELTRAGIQYESRRA
ncbi:MULTISPECIES: hypothetical protein [unclassified Streptomyces]|uniref:hypothetical protein n=1 Tax=Streptomyces TaxID=1883 RepID=UPI002814CD06|nr:MULTISPECIES: hypothetical protein [unclassified Streptomyces]